MFLSATTMRAIGSLVAASAMVLLVPMAAMAAEVQSGDSITIGPNQVVADDLYAFGNNVLIQGTVRGDVIAAGSTITVSGHVTGSVMAAGSNVSVSGPVDGSVRIAGTSLMLTAPVAGDALMAGSAVAINDAAHVGRDALLAGATMNVQGPIARDVRAAGSRLTVASAVGGGLSARVNELVVGDGAVIAGPVSYVSGQDAMVAPTARVGGAIQRTAPVTTNNPWVIAGIDLLTLVRGVVGLTLLGLVLIVVFPRATLESCAQLSQRWAASLGVGLAVLLATPVVALGVFLLGLLVGGWWIALLLLGACVMLSVFGYLATAEWLGLTMLRALKTVAHPVWAMVVGVFGLGVLGLIPVVGGLLLLAAIVVGVGGITLEAWQAYQHSPESAGIPVSAPERVPLAAAA